MPMDFPNSPTLNQTYTVSGTTWIWNGTTWDVVRISTGASGPTGATGPSGASGATGPTGPQGPATLPQNSQTSAYILQSSDNGKYIDITTGGVSVTTATAMTAGQNAVIYNNSGSSQTITQGSSVTLRWAGTSNTGNRTIPAYGVVTILCVASNTYLIAGPGLS
jgi:hypothetical protein